MESVQRLNHVVDGIQKAAIESLDQAKDQVVKTSKQTVQRVDQSVHTSPWVFVGVASAISGILGFALGRRLK